MNKSTIGAALAMLREERGWTQAQLAARVMHSRSTVANIETGACTPSLDMLADIAAPLGMRVWELLRFADRLRETIDTRHQDNAELTAKTWRAA